jgi:hypothetical protein
MKPRTVCFCQPVNFWISGRLTPLARCRWPPTEVAHLKLPTSRPVWQAGRDQVAVGVVGVAGHLVGRSVHGRVVGGGTASSHLVQFYKYDSIARQTMGCCG